MSAALTGLLNDFVASASGEHKEWIERAVSMAQAMIDEGEADIALENFCENLIEWQCPIKRELFAQLQQQAAALGVDATVLSGLQKQIK